MNIIEAFKSGKRFRRKDYHTAWFSSSDVMPWGPSDILAMDWEVEETPIQITESDFEAAVVRANQSFSIYNPPHICEYLTQLKKELGL